MNTINNISCQPLQPKQNMSFKGNGEETALVLANKESLDDFVKDPDAVEKVSNLVIDLADKGNKGVKTVGTLAMIAGIGAGGYFVASRAARRVLSSLSGNTKYLDNLSDKAINVFNKLEKKVSKLDAGENPGKLKKAVVNFVKDVPEKIKHFATKDLDQDTLRKNFAKTLSKGAADLSEDELAKFPGWLKEAKGLDLGAAKTKFAETVKKNIDEIKPEEFADWVKETKGIDLSLAKSEFAKTFFKTVNDLNPDDLAKFNDFQTRTSVKNAISKIAGGTAGIGAATKAVADAGEDKNGDGIPDSFQQSTIKDKFNKAVGEVVVGNAAGLPGDLI